jgi:outer membrane receptor protein involved in Fe transport
LIVKLIRLAYAAGIIVVSGGCAADHLTAPPQPSRICIDCSGLLREPITPALFIVDGRVVTPGPGFTLPGIDPDQIADIQVVRGAHAVKLYGPAASAGVIIITTKAGAASGQAAVTPRPGVGRILIRGSSAISGDPLVLVDGRAVSAASLQDIAADQILDVEVVKGPAAVERYGERAGGGAIVVRTKRADDTL